MTEATEPLDTDFETPELPAHEILYDDGAPVEVPEPTKDDEPEDLLSAAEDDGDVYEQARREVQTEQQIAAGANAVVTELLTFAKGLGVDPRHAAAYLQAGKTAELLEAVQQLGLQAARKIEDKGRRVAAEMDVRNYVNQCNQKLGQLRSAAQQVYGRKMEREQKKVEKAHESARSKLIAECPQLDNESEAQAFQEYLVKTRGYTVEQIAACSDHRPLAAEYKAWRMESPPPKKKYVLPGRARIRVKSGTKPNSRSLSEQKRGSDNVLSILYGPPKPQPKQNVKSPGRLLAERLYARR